MSTVSECPVNGVCPMKKSLSDKLGGEKIVFLIIKNLYAKIMKDDSLKGFFKGVNITELTRKQTDFSVFAFGGEEQWYGKQMTEAHKGLGISNDNFNRVGELYVETMKELGIPDELINEVGSVNEQYRSSVVTV